MYMAGGMSTSTSFAVGDLGNERYGLRDSHAESVSVDITEIELQPSIFVDRDVRLADLDAPAAPEATHLQERCVDMATELFELQTKFVEQEKELKWAKREADARERDFKEVQRVCEEERRSSKSFMRRVKTLEEEKSTLIEENGKLRLDRDRLLGVLRRHREAGWSESAAAHRDRLRKRNMSEKEVNRCDLASAKLGLKATRQEKKRLISKARAQASRIRELEDGTEVLARKVSEIQQEANTAREEKAAVQQAADEAMASQRRAMSDMEHEALLRLEAAEVASEAQKAEEESREARASAELEAEVLRAQLAKAVEQLEAKDSARARHQGSVARYQTMIDVQAAALQTAREQLLGEKVRRQESERQARLRHIAAVDAKSRASCAAATAAAAAAAAAKASPAARAKQQQQQQQVRRLSSSRKTVARMGQS